MKQLRAIILLVIYSTFTIVPAFARHYCANSCLNKAAAHNNFSEATAPGECTEKEAVNNQFTEHRSGAILKFALSAVTKPREPRTPVAESRQNNLRAGLKTVFSTGYSTPLYISHCVYRL